MEGTPLLRFVCATFAMRREWEGGSKRQRCIGDAARARTQCAAPLDAPSFARVKEEDVTASSTFFASPQGVDEDERRLISDWIANLECAMAAESDAQAAETVYSVCKHASDVGSLNDLVTTVITTVLDMDDTASDERQQQLSEVLLRMCFEPNASASDVVPTAFCEIVVTQLEATIRDLVDLVGEEEVCVHMGGRILDRTLRIIDDTLRPRLNGDAVV